MTSQAPGVWPPSGPEIIFLLLGAVAVGSAPLVVTTRQLVHAAHGWPSASARSRAAVMMT